MKLVQTALSSSLVVLLGSVVLSAASGCGQACKAAEDCEGQLVCTKSAVCYDDPAIATNICAKEGWKNETDPKTGLSMICSGYGLCYPYYEMVPLWVQPLSVIQPIVPVQPILNPVIPVQPVQPVQPVFPVQPVQPVVPVQPVQPIRQVVGPAQVIVGKDGPKVG